MVNTAMRLIQKGLVPNDRRGKNEIIVIVYVPGVQPRFP